MSEKLRDLKALWHLRQNVFSGIKFCYRTIFRGLEKAAINPAGAESCLQNVQVFMLHC